MRVFTVSDDEFAMNDPRNFGWRWFAVYVIYVDILTEKSIFLVMLSQSIPKNIPTTEKFYQNVR